MVQLLLALVLLVVLIPTGSLLGGVIKSQDLSTIVTVLSTVVSIIFIFAAIINTFSNHQDQVRDIEDIQAQVELGAIYVNRMTLLLTEFRVILLEKYPNYEKELLKELKPESVGVLFQTYPDLKAYEGMAELVKQMRGLQDSITRTQTDTVDCKRRIRTRLRSKWILPRILPKE